MKYLANTITISRIVASLILLLLIPFTMPYYIIFAYCGISDMADGTIARKTGTASKSGAMLDSVSDIVFAAVCAVILFSSVSISVWMWIWTGVIIFLRLINLVLSLIRFKKPVFLHTMANKVTGLMIFVWMLTLNMIPIQWSVPVVCTLASFASVQEGYFIFKGRQDEKL